MGILKKEVKSVSFADELNNIKSIFRTAYNQAKELDSKIQEDIDTKESMIAGLQTTINDFKTTQSETQKFIKNLEKFI